MKTPEKTRLLEEILHDEDYALFRRRLFAETLGEFRGGHRAPWQSPGLALAACLVLTVGLWLALRPQSTNRIVRPTRPSMFVVRTTPLQKGQLVTTSSRTALAPPVLVASTLPPMTVLRTDESPGLLTDEQLLDLFSGHPVALISLPDGGRSLVFLEEIGE